jgi:soluble lytic murein transglycosylase
MTLALLSLLSIPTLAAPGPSPLTTAQAVSAGDCATVLQQTGGDAANERWRVPRAWCSLRMEEPEAALSLLAEPVDGVLGEYGRLVAGQAHLALGDLDRATAALDGLSLPGAAGTELAATRARLAIARADLEGFRSVMKALPEGSERDFLYGEALFAAGQKETAWKTWRAVWVDAQVGGFDTRAEARLAATGAPPLTDAERVDRLARLRRNGRIDEASSLAEALGEAAATDPDLPSDPIELARVQLQARQYTDSLTHWRTALGAPEEAVGSARNLFDYALTNARTGDYDTAAVVYERVIAQHPGHEKADFASYKLGYMSYDENDCPTAIERFDAHLKRFPASRHLTEALWFTARCHWRSGDVDAAIASLDRLVQERPKSSLVPGALYWKARAAGLAGDAEAERAGLQRVLRSWPVNGYAWFAAQRLGTRFEPKPAVARPAWPERLAKRADVTRFEALLAVGLADWARDELAPVRGALSTREEKLAAAHAFIAAGDYRTGRSLAKPYCVSPWKDGDPVAQQACTPRPEAGIVSAVAERFDLHPLLPYGIMTAESALKPQVTSVAGARGLMQIMPLEGPRIHEQLYTGPYDADDLYKAPYNASMGTAELGMKRQSLKGMLQQTDLPAVIASYNGGEAAVRRWLEAYDEPPPFDTFAEDVGYTETRRYVKRVLGFVMAYRWVYGDPTTD